MLHRHSNTAAARLPVSSDNNYSSTGLKKDIYLAAGCFWGAEHYFKQIRGVVATEAGYANGNIFHPTYEEVKTFLAQQPEPPAIDVAYCENDNEAFGTIRALEENGYPCGPDGVTVISFDATYSGMELCARGKIALEVECNPLLGPLVEQAIQTLEAGGHPAPAAVCGGADLHPQRCHRRPAAKPHLLMEYYGKSRDTLRRVPGFLRCAYNVSRWPAPPVPRAAPGTGRVRPAASPAAVRRPPGPCGAGDGAAR